MKMPNKVIHPTQNNWAADLGRSAGTYLGIGKLQVPDTFGIVGSSVTR